MAERPEAYPSGYEHVVVLADGRPVFLRPVVPDDVTELAAAVRRADRETIRRRFLGAAGPRTEQELRHLVEVDYDHRFAVVAFDEAGTGIGIARYEGATTWPAVELAVVVDSGWRHVGLATALLRDVLHRAVEQGAHTAEADYFTDNVPVAHLLRDLELPQRFRTAYGVVEDEVQLDGLQVPASRVPARSRLSGRPPTEGEQRGATGP